MLSLSNHTYHINFIKSKVLPTCKLLYLKYYTLFTKNIHNQTFRPISSPLHFTKLCSTASSSFNTITKFHFQSSISFRCYSYTQNYNNKFNTSSPRSALDTDSSTIYSLSTPWGVSGVSVIRISGPSAGVVLDKMTVGSLNVKKALPRPQPRKATRRYIVSQFLDNINSIGNDNVDVIDDGLVLYFPGPNSATGEDMVELHLHGSLSVIQDTLKSIKMLGKEFRQAEPGEFTKRSWINGKISDLTELEAVADLIHAETREQRRQAMNQFQGQLSKLYSYWTTEIHTCLAYIEALVDFGHDELLDEMHISEQVVPRIRAILNEMRNHLNDSHRGQILRNGLSVVLVGKPNAGKSSLLNCLSRSDAAIVSPEAGTTRDVVESRLDLAGYPIILQDTAGLNTEENIGTVEKLGIMRTLDRFKTANIRLIVIDCTSFESLQDPSIKEMLLEYPDSSIIVLNKMDLIVPNFKHTSPDDQISTRNEDYTVENSKLINTYLPWMKEHPILDNIPVIGLSCSNNYGIENLEKILLKQVNKFFTTHGSSTSPTLTRERHRENVVSCVEALERFLECLDHVELAAEELRLAGKSIARITGKVDVEQILDIVFRDFCIGK